MNITINVDESMFKDIIEKELKAFSSEELHEIIKGLIREYLSSSDLIKELFVKKEYDRFYNTSKDVPTDLLRNICSKVDLNDACNEVKDSMVKVITEDSRSIVTELISRSLSKMLMESLSNQGNLQEAIYRQFVILNHPDNN